MLYFFYLIFIVVVFARCGKSSDILVPPKATLPHGGVIVGSYMTTVNGQRLKAFRGVPYAEPPTGDLRFKSPLPAKPWSGEKLADKDPDVCLQQDPYTLNFTTVGNEDCLYLNVYVPENPKTSYSLSVMVYFHGGGWITGNGNSALYGPERLLDHDVILVIGNYRLGALGFLSTATLDCPGNFGTKDQVMILKWISENVQIFNGNPNDVTIFGESAGAASVGYHIYSPLSKGLFHKAMLLSGTNFGVWTLGEKSVTVNRTLEVGSHLKCVPGADGDWKPFMDCLRSKPAFEIASVVRQLFKYDIDPVILFPVVVEPEAADAFVTKRPTDVLNPPSAAVPVVIGMTSGDGIVRSGPILNNILSDFKQNWETALPYILFYYHLPKDVQMERTRRINEFYFHGKHDWSLQNHENLTNLFTDVFFTWNIDQFLRHRFEAAKSTTVGQTYVYVFDHRGTKSLSEMFLSGPDYLGVCHMDEMPYLFDFHFLEGNDNDNMIKKAMPEMWTNFAITGNPTPEGSFMGVWHPATKFPLEYAHIGRQTVTNWTLLTNEIGFFEDRITFWREIEKAEAI